MDTYRDILRQYWHYDDFRPLQAEIIHSVGSGRDTLALMPTGGGKSLCFQVPTMAMKDPCDETQEGLCLVVTPLVALMKDQVDNLKRRDIRAAAIYSGLTYTETQTLLDNCQFGGYKFLYVSPERLESEAFRKRLVELPICMLAVDEAHCISQWGYDFRPPYLRIAAIREVLQERLRLRHIDHTIPILALTATATPDVVDDIQEKLAFREKHVLSKSFRRDNLSYQVRQVDAAETGGNVRQAKMLKAKQILDVLPGSSIIYVRNREQTREMAEWLCTQGHSATYYHAGLNRQTKESRQNDWKAGKVRVMVATNAFGMGIDKEDVRSVIHLDSPSHLEAYFQEAGRAGRDGKEAFAVLLYHPEDQQRFLRRITDTYPDKDFIIRVYDALGNFFEVGLGSGLDHTFPFDFAAFCQQTHFPLLPTFSAIQILSQAGYITYIDEHETNPRVRFTVTRDALYSEQVSLLQEDIIQLLLRRYTGIFTEPAYIDDVRMADDLHITTKDLNHELILLAQQGLLSYIPRRKTPYITWSQERLQPEYIKLPKRCYEERLDLFKEKITAMAEYAEQQQFCRSQLLLAYFGETDSEPCGTCDVCRRKKKEEAAD